jgi:hypothetical protein
MLPQFAGGQLGMTHSRGTSSASLFQGQQLRYGATEVIHKKVRSMVIVYALVALAGGLVSCVLLWSYGATIALLSMPFGGSLFVLIAAVLVYMRASGEADSSNERAVYKDQPQKLQTTES